MNAGILQAERLVMITEDVLELLEISIIKSDITSAHPPQLLVERRIQTSRFPRSIISYGFSRADCTSGYRVADIEQNGQGCLSTHGRGTARRPTNLSTAMFQRQVHSVPRPTSFASRGNRSLAARKSPNRHRDSNMCLFQFETRFVMVGIRFRDKTQSRVN